MKKIFKKVIQHSHILFLLFIIFLAVKPLVHPGLPPTHDGEYHLVRFYEFDQAIRDGDWYPRWAKDFNNGYGIPLFNYVYPLPNYVASLLHLFGISFIDGVKLNLLLATLIGVLFFYFWSRLFFDKASAMVGAVFYAFAPYRFVDIYVRGSVGEVWALGWFPAFLWAVTKLIKTGKVKYIIWSGVFFALTVLSHNIVALIFACFGGTYVIYLLWLEKVNKKIIFFSLFSFLLGLLLSAIFWLSAILETKLATGLQIFDITRHFPEIYQLLIPSWGTGFSGEDLDNQMSFQIGIANLLVIIAGFVLLIRSRYSFFIGWFVLTFFLMLNYSLFIWKTVPLLNYFQFPWRLLSLTILVCAFIAGAVLNKIKSKKKKILFSFIFIAIAIFSTISYTQPAYYHYRTDSYYLSRDNFMLGTNSPGNVFNTIWMNTKLEQKKQRIEIVEGKGNIIVQEIKTSKVKFRVKNETNVRMNANIAYFPGWRLFIDGKEKEMQRTKDGIISFTLPRGDYIILLQFDDTMTRSIGKVITFLGVIICILLFLNRKKIEKKMKIAIDITPLSDTRLLSHKVRGTGFYLEYLKRSLLKFYPEINYQFFSKGEEIPGNVDLVHYPYFEPFFPTLPLFEKHKRVVTVHDLTPIVFSKNFPAGIKGNLFWQIQKWALKNSSLIITDSKSSKKDIIKYTGINSDKIAVVYLAAGEEFKKLKRGNWEKDIKTKYNLPDKFVLYVGDVTWNKNLPRLIRAVQSINVPLVMVGKALVEENFDKTNPWNQDLVEVHRLADVDDKILRLGFVPTEDLVALYNLTTVFVMPSIYEGFGLPLVEAMKCGGPAIATKEGSLPEVGGEAVYYVDAFDSNSIASGIEKVFSSEKLQENLSMQGIEQSKKFSWQETAKQTVDAYRTCLGSKL